MSQVLFAPGWDNILKQTATFKQWKKLEALQRDATAYYQNFGKLLTPSYSNLYRALELTFFADTKVVLLGQDPYPDSRKATGLAFSVGDIPNWHRDSMTALADLLADDGCGTLTTGNLTSWAQQGVLLLNRRLNHRNAADHNLKVIDKTLDWPLLTKLMIQALNQRTTPVIFVLWGRDALSMEPLITESQHYIVRASHPSQMSRRRWLANGTIKPFVQSNSFRLINERLGATGQGPIEWC